MYAVKKNLTKVLAAFLCACLLLSYNPAFGAIDAAWADDEPGTQPSLSGMYAPSGSNTDDQMQPGNPTDYTVDTETNTVTGTGPSTSITASTYNSALQAAMTTGPLFGTISQIAESTNPYQLIVQATTSEANSADEYTFTWSVKNETTDEDMSDADLATLASYSTKDFVTANNVATYTLDLRALLKAQPEILKNDSKYVFTCNVDVTPVSGATVPNDPTATSVELYTIKDLEGQDPTDPTVQGGYYNNKHIESADEPPVVAESTTENGVFLDTATLKTELDSSSSGVLGVFSNAASIHNTDYETFDILVKDGKTSVYGVGIEGGLTIPTAAGNITLPPTNGQPYKLLFPINDAFVYNAETNSIGYRAGDLITVLWKTRIANLSADLKEMQASIVSVGEEGQLMAEVTYYPVGTKTGVLFPSVEAKDSAGATATYINDMATPNANLLPGYFALVYSSNKTQPENPNDPDFIAKAKYSVSATVTGDTDRGAILGQGLLSTLTGNGEVVRVSMGNAVSFNLLPQTVDGTHSYLKSLTFKEAPSAPAKDVLNGEAASLGITIDAARSCVTIGQPACDQYYATYSFEAEFAAITDTPSIGDIITSNPQTHKLYAIVVDDANPANKSNNGFITSGYLGVVSNKAAMQDAQGNDLALDVCKNGYADLKFWVNVGFDGARYEIKGVETSLTGDDGTWRAAAWNPGCALSLPYMTGDMHVRVRVGSTSAPTTQPTYYDVNVVKSVADDDYADDPEYAKCTVAPTTGIIATGDNGAPYTTLRVDMTGTDGTGLGGFYAQKVIAKYKELNGRAVEVEYVLSAADGTPQDEAKVTSPMSFTYEPSAAVLAGQVMGPITLDVVFHTTNPTPRKMTITTPYGGGQVTVVKGGKLTGDNVWTIGSGSDYTLMMVPDGGKTIGTVRVDGEAVNSVVAGMFWGQMPDKDITVSVAFGEDEVNSPDAMRTLGVYVADNSLIGNDDLKYMWAADAPAVKNALGETVSGFGENALNGKSNTWGLVNSTNTAPITAELPATSPYVLNFQGQKVGSKQYVVDQVLVTTYNEVPDLDNEGAYKKNALSRTLYDWNDATFALNTTVWGGDPGVDVIVFFREYVEGSETKPLDQYQPEPDAYVSVVIEDDRPVLNDATLEPGRLVRVVPGSYVTLTGLTLKDTYVWRTPYFEIKGMDVSEDDIKKARETGVLELGPVPQSGSIVITPVAQARSEVQRPTYNVYAASNFSGSTATLNGTVYVTSGSGVPGAATATSPQTINRGDLVTVSITPNTMPDYYKMTSVAFDFDEDVSLQAWVSTGPVNKFYELLFQSENPGEGYQKYSAKTVLNVTDDENLLAWHVAGLESDLTVVPVFEQTERPPFVDTGDTWAVQASIASGSGSLSITSDGALYGNEVRIPKDDGDKASVEVNIAPSEGYKIGNVTIQSPKNGIFGEIWSWITGESAQLDELAATVEASGGKLVLSPVDRHYKVFVEFEFVSSDSAREDTTTVPVNVFSDSFKGTVSPDTNVRAARNGTPQFMVTPQKDKDGIYYEIDEVTITPRYIDLAGNMQAGTPLPVKAGASSTYLTWAEGSSNLVFSLNMTAIGEQVTSRMGTFSAVDLEVTYVEGSSTPGGGSTTSPAVDPEDPGYDDFQARVKKVDIKTNEGGNVSPLGDFTMFADATKQVYVSAAEGYALKGLKVTRGDSSANIATLANKYLQQITASSTLTSIPFEIEAKTSDPTSLLSETITLEFEKLSAEDSTYTIRTRTAGEASGTISPTKVVTLANNESFSYTIDPETPDTYVVVADEYRLDSSSNEWHPTDPSNAAQLFDENNCLVVNPLSVMGKVVDRRITVSFYDKETLPDELDPDNTPKTDPIPDAKKANIKVTVYGFDGSSQALDVIPGFNMSNVLKSDHSNYVYSWSFTPEELEEGYRVYYVEVNGVRVAGQATPTTSSLLTVDQAGKYVFTQDKLTAKTNTLKIYTGKYPGGVVPPPAGSWTGSFDYEFTGNGSIIASDSSKMSGYMAGLAGFGDSSFASRNMAASSSTDLVFGNALRSNEDGDEEEEIGREEIENPGSAELPTKTYTIVPDPLNVIDHVYLMNCHPYPEDKPSESWRWITPKDALGENANAETLAAAYGDSWETPIVLVYTLQLDASDLTGFISVEFKQVPSASEVPDMSTWNPTSPDNSSKLGENNLVIEFLPAEHAMAVAGFMSDAVVPVIELYKGTTAMGDTMVKRPNVTISQDKTSWTVNWSTHEDHSGGVYTFLIGPLLPTSADTNIEDRLYTIDTDKTAAVVDVKAVPESQAKAAQSRSLNMAEGDEALDASAAEEVDGTTTEDATAAEPNFYRYYRVTAPADALKDSSNKVTIQIPLKKMSKDDGVFEGLTFGSGGNNQGGGNDDDNQGGNNNTNNGPFELTADVKVSTTGSTGDAIGGTLTPTSTNLSGNWSNGNTTGPWTLAKDSWVAFSVQARTGFLLTGLTRSVGTTASVVNCLGSSGEYQGDGKSGTLQFQITDRTALQAVFSADTSDEAKRTVTIEVVGGNGTTSPKPGSYDVPVGSSYEITFKPNDGYVPRYIWVNGRQSYAGPTWNSYVLSSSWDDQTFRVQYALSGSTPGGADPWIQTGYNAMNDAGALLSNTGDNPVAIAGIVGVALLAAGGIWQVRRRKAATEARAAKYSVTKRK